MTTKRMITDKLRSYGAAKRLIPRKITGGRQTLRDRDQKPNPKIDRQSLRYPCQPSTR